MSNDHRGSWLKQRVRISQLEFDLHRAEQKAEKHANSSLYWRGVCDNLKRDWNSHSKEYVHEIARLEKENTALCKVINHPDFISIRDRVLEEMGVKMEKDNDE